MRDVIVIGGGFAGVTAAREAALQQRDVVLFEARDRLGGRTWTASWHDQQIEYGGGWVHWHQPHTWSEITRAGLAVELSEDAGSASWFVGGQRHEGSIGERDAIAEVGWNQFVDGVQRALPNPYDPQLAMPELERFDRLTIAQRIDQLDLSDEQRDVLWAELESMASAPLDEAGAVSVLRWHALSGFSMALTQYAGGRVTLTDGTGGLLRAIAGQAQFETRLETVVAAVHRHDDMVEVEMRDGELMSARAVVLAVPLNTLAAIEFQPPLPEAKREAITLGQSSRGAKIFIHADGDPRHHNAIRREHPFGYLDTEIMIDGGSQILIGFGADGARCDATDIAAVQSAMDEIMPGRRVLDATAHDWLGDEFSRGTWAIHRPGWYGRHHREMRRPEGRLLIAGSDVANGWSGFIDGAIESGLWAGAWASATAR